MAISAETIRQLHRYEISILHVLERLMRTHNWVPLDTIRRTVRLSESEVLYRLGRLMDAGMVRYDTVPYEGYSLVFLGYDALALLSLTQKGVVKALGCQIGEGKESVVYEALGLGQVALKFHHVGQRSFQTTRVSREYLGDEGHCPRIFVSQSSAEREYAALTRLHPGVQAPLGIDQNRNVVVMEFIPGVNLNRCRLEDPRAILDEILNNILAAYKAGVIHADLSEFNVMLDGDRVVLIDWPQWISPDHPNAREILGRDLENITKYFQRKYSLRVDPREVLEGIRT